MPSLVETRPNRPTLMDPSTPRDVAATWPNRAVAWLRGRAAGLVPRGSCDPTLGQFAELAASARDPVVVRVALVRLAADISGAARAELLRDRAGTQPRRLACWPPNSHADPIAEVGESPRGPLSRALAHAREARSRSRALCLTLKAGEAHIGMLRLTSRGPSPWQAGTEARLRALCAIAATAERALSVEPGAKADRRLEADDGPEGSVILGAFLGFAHAQARRRREPLSLLEVAVDRLSALRELLGDELAGVAIDRTARAARSTVRASDVITRLEDGRLAVILPNASAENALKVAEAIRQAVVRAGAASTTMPTLTASIGVATYPDHAHDVATLRAAAASALTRAESLGHDRIAEALAAPSPADRGQLAG